ncbi:hypothetical protein ACFFLZ_14230 [Photobacterium aphoticum]|nr:hypothetical protein [Photobacterium aphoticum]GHA42058.1 hypothetical protein GCM10007086_14560 [Photobacterium aphoticum]
MKLAIITGLLSIAFSTTSIAQSDIFTDETLKTSLKITERLMTDDELNTLSSLSGKSKTSVKQIILTIQETCMKDIFLGKKITDALAAELEQCVNDKTLDSFDITQDTLEKWGQQLDNTEEKELNAIYEEMDKLMNKEDLTANEEKRLEALSQQMQTLIYEESENFNELLKDIGGQ